MQYWIWAETIDSGRHGSLKMPPKESISNRREKKDTDSGGSLTPSKVANLHSTYIQQTKIFIHLRKLEPFQRIICETKRCTFEQYGQTSVSNNTI